MLYTILYDITDNKTRNKVIMKCKNYGLIRTQKSIFMGELTKNKAEMLTIEIKEFSFSENDKVFVIPACDSCFTSKEIVGKIEEEKIKDRNFVIISNEGR